MSAATAEKPAASSKGTRKPMSDEQKAKLSKAARERHERKQAAVQMDEAPTADEQLLDTFAQMFDDAITENTTRTTLAVGEVISTKIDAALGPVMERLIKLEQSVTQPAPVSTETVTVTKTVEPIEEDLEEYDEEEVGMLRRMGRRIKYEATPRKPSRAQVKSAIVGCMLQDVAIVGAARAFPEEIGMPLANFLVPAAS